MSLRGAGVSYAVVPFRLRGERPMMTRCFLAMLALAATLLLTVPVADATTHAPCTQRYAGTPYIDTVDPGAGEEGTTTILQGGGQIGGCPLNTSTTAEGVHILVCLQHFDEVWTDQACQQFDRGWNRYTRFARQAGGTVSATCVPGDWRVEVRGNSLADGWDPNEWAGETFTVDCLELSGGD